MKISERYGPQFDASDGTIGSLKLVKRWVLYTENYTVWPARQGRYTYESEEIAVKRLTEARKALWNNGKYAQGLSVKAVWCYPTHFDPAGLCEELQSETVNQSSR